MLFLESLKCLGHSENKFSNFTHSKPESLRLRNIITNFKYECHIVSAVNIYKLHYDKMQGEYVVQML